LNVNTNWDDNTISEKWEGLAILPLNDPAAPNDFLLLVGNDNDFRASTVYHNGVVVGTNALTIDSMMLAFRIGADRTPPTIQCPTNIVRLPPPPVSPSRPGDPPTPCRRALYSLSSLVTATDNSAAPISFIQTPAPGTTLTLGTPITITIIAVDAGGNQSGPCSFVVIFDDVHPF